MAAKLFEQGWYTAPMDAGVAMGGVGGVHVSIWWRPAEPASVLRLKREAKAVAASEGTVYLLLIVREGTGLSPQEARDAAAKMLQDLGQAVGCVAIVIEGSGFGPAAVRAMFTGLGFIVRRHYPWKMFATERDAIEWIQSTAGTRPIHGARVARLISSLRSEQ